MFVVTVDQVMTMVKWKRFPPAAGVAMPGFLHRLEEEAST